jgi:malic enzyme
MGKPRHLPRRALSDDHLTEDYIVLKIFDRHVVRAVARAVSRAAQETGVARRSHRKSH